MDGIPANILKLTSTLIAPSITFIFNLSIRTGIYIDEWKLARVEHGPIPRYDTDGKFHKSTIYHRYCCQLVCIVQGTIRVVRLVRYGYGL